MRELRDDVEGYRREVKESLLDYEALYDKVRVNLAKLAKRASDDSKTPENGPQSGADLARQMLLQRKFGR